MYQATTTGCHQVKNPLEHGVVARQRFAYKHEPLYHFGKTDLCGRSRIGIIVIFIRK